MILQTDVDSRFAIKDILTAVSIIVSIIALLYAWYKDRLLRKKEYADRIRRATSLVTAKLERWKELALRFFEDIQPLITDTDMMLTKEQNNIAARDHLWRGLVATHAESTRRILDEQIEISYSELYGYDSRIRLLFIGTIQLLKQIEHSTFTKVLYATQANVAKLETVKGQIYSAQLGNTLRYSCGNIALELGTAIDDVLNPFRAEIMKLIEASDSDIVNKRVYISSPDKVLPTLEVNVKRIIIRFDSDESPELLYQGCIQACL
jgi:hypothetical protein